MNLPPEIETLLKSGDLAGATAALKAAIRKAPAEPGLRFSLFQLLSTAGDYEGASNQLVACSEMSGRQAPLPIIFNGALGGEVLRKLVFQGEKTPVCFGEPPEWMPLLIQAAAHFARGEHEAAAALRTQALDAAPAISGTCNGQPFAWLMDGDSRFGPVLEIILRGTYYWLPQQRVRSITFAAPTHVRDRIWAAAEITLETGGVTSGFMPVRYPGAHTWNDGSLQLAKTTAWDSPADGLYLGSGQRVFMTDSAEIPLLEVRELTFSPA